MSRTTSGSSAAAPGVSANGASRTRANTNPLPPSDVKLYVTNLRLLDLDRHSDWPHITVHSFSSRNADQKQRICGVEWSLFRLFEIWDPQETSQKLQPFFPPLEPLQSLNLRAALYRCLNELKKNGVLGRECVLRKTMLDECKGEKFFEVLAVFSNAVLKKVVSTRRSKRDHAAVARTLATATTLPSDRQTSLVPLAIAHKAALVDVLKKKNEKRRKFADFEALLEARASGINQKIKQCKATPRTQKFSVPEKDAASIKKQLMDNWIGDQRWLETLLYGDGVQVEDAFLGMQFDDVLSMVEQGHKPEDALPQTGLLENLQLRVQEQQRRLQKWKRFHESLRRDKPLPSLPNQTKQIAPKDIQFDGHLKLQLLSSRPSDEAALQKGPIRGEYQDILMDMDAELLNMSQVVYQRPAVPVLSRGVSLAKPTAANMERKQSKSNPVRKQSSNNVKNKALALPSRLKKHSSEAIPSRPSRRELAATHLDSETTLVGPPSTTSRHVTLEVEEPLAELQLAPVVVEMVSKPLPEVSSSLFQQSKFQSPQPTPPPISSWPSGPPVLAPPSLNPEDALAEQIISSVGEATPSPVKKQPRLSLMQRTQLSMAGKTSFEPITEAPSPSSPPILEIPTASKPTLDRQASLIERTRLTMAAMSLQPPAAQMKKDKRKSKSCESLFPVNQFDTPRTRKSFQAVEASKSGDSTPKEVLFSDDIDYSHVFKSRPRVAHSPIFSPSQADGNSDISGLECLGVAAYDDDEFDEGVTGVDLADVDADDEDGFTHAWENSPSRAKGKLFG